MWAETLPSRRYEDDHNISQHMSDMPSSLLICMKSKHLTPILTAGYIILKTQEIGKPKRQLTKSFK